MLFDLIESTLQFRQVSEAIGKSFLMPAYAAGLSGAQRAMLGYALAKKTGRQILIITPDEASATKVSEDISALAGSENVALYPVKDFQFRGVESASAE